MSNTPPLPPDAMSCEAAGRLIGVTGKTISRWIDEGKLAGFAVGTRRKVSREDVLGIVKRVAPARGKPLMTKAERRARDAETDEMLRILGIRK